MLPRSKVTSKYQVTIPLAVREKVEVRPGEVVSVEAISKDEIVVRRYPGVGDPLLTLIGKKASIRAIPIEKVEELAESR